MIHRILDTEAEGGLNCRRCQWYTTTLNLKSQAAAIRLGFKFEGNMRAQRVLEKGWKGARRESGFEPSVIVMTYGTFSWPTSTRGERDEGLVVRFYYVGRVGERRQGAHGQVDGAKVIGMEALPIACPLWTVQVNNHSIGQSVVWHRGPGSK